MSAISSDAEIRPQQPSQTIAQLLDRTEALLDSNDARQALDLLGDVWRDDRQGRTLPARARLLRGKAMLQRDDSGGIAHLFEAAEQDPSLLQEVVRVVEKWLHGAGAAHGNMLLRHELLRMQTLHRLAQAERAGADGTERHTLPDAAITHVIGRALAPWEKDIRVAWLAQRVCRHAPRWRHLDLLLEMKPRRWHFQPNARARLEEYLRQIRQALPKMEGTIAVRCYPLLASPAHLRNMRRQARRLILRAEATDTPCADDSGTDRGERQADDGNPPPKRPRRRRSALLKGVMLAAVMSVPIGIGWNLLANQETRQKLSALETRHAALLARHDWRREEAAGMFSPEKTVHAFLRGLRKGDAYPEPAVLDEASRRAWRKKRFTSARLRALAAQWINCGTPRAHVDMQRAVVLWSGDISRCMPLLLRREGGRWRVAWNETRATFATDAQGRWRFSATGKALPRQWLFAFRGGLVDGNGLFHPVRGTTGKGGLIVPPATAPHDENAPPLRSSLLERNAPEPAYVLRNGTEARLWPVSQDAVMLREAATLRGSIAHDR